MSGMTGIPPRVSRRAAFLGPLAAAAVVGAATIFGQGAGAQQQTGTGSTQLAAAQTPERPYRNPFYLPADVDSAIVKCGKAITLKRDGTKYGGYVTLQMWHPPGERKMFLHVRADTVDRSIEWRTPAEAENARMMTTTFTQSRPDGEITTRTSHPGLQPLRGIEAEIEVTAAALLREARPFAERLYEAACRGQAPETEVTLDAKQPEVQALFGKIQRVAWMTDRDVPLEQRLRVARQELSMR